MTKSQYVELKRLLAEINVGRADPNLSPETRSELDLTAATISGKLLSIWLPIDWP